MANGINNPWSIPTSVPYGGSDPGYTTYTPQSTIPTSLGNYGGQMYPDAAGINYLTNFGSPAPSNTAVPSPMGGGTPPASGGGGAMNIPAANFNYGLDSGFFANQNANITAEDAYGPSNFTPQQSNIPVSTPPPSSGAFGEFLGKPSTIAGLGSIAVGLMGRAARRNDQVASLPSYEEAMENYRKFDFDNLYANFENQFQNLENPYEDLTVNQQQAEFEREMFERQQANIMSGLAGAAGGSGIGGLAQAMANQAQVQARRAAGTIGMQESRNQMLRAKGAMQVQMAEAGGAERAQRLRIAGAEQQRALEFGRIQTELAMAQRQKAIEDQRRAQQSKAIMGGIGTIVGGAIGGPLGASIGSSLLGSL